MAAVALCQQKPDLADGGRVCAAMVRTRWFRGLLWSGGGLVVKRGVGGGGGEYGCGGSKGQGGGPRWGRRFVHQSHLPSASNFSEEGSFLPKGTKLFRWYPESADSRAFVCCSIARLIRATNGVAMAGPWIHSTRCGPHWRDLGGRPVRTNRVLVLSSVGYPVGSATLQPPRAKLP